MVRPKLPEGQRRQDIDPAKRGFPQLGRVSKATKDRIDRYRGERSYTEAINALLDLTETPPQSAAKVPWDVIQDQLLMEFGFANKAKIDVALHSAGMPQK